MVCSGSCGAEPAGLGTATHRRHAVADTHVAVLRLDSRGLRHSRCRGFGHAPR